MSKSLGHKTCTQRKELMPREYFDNQRSKIRLIAFSVCIYTTTFLVVALVMKMINLFVINNSNVNDKIAVVTVFLYNSTKNNA